MSNNMDETAASLGISRDEFLANLTASQLVKEREIVQLLLDHPGSDTLALANALLASGSLTDYQLDALVAGRAAELRIGNYDILGRLGAGGMGTVLKARHRRMKRVVALKVLATSLCKDEAFVLRFQREVETIARLGHPNIVMAYDADEAEVGHFLVMEFVDGQDLTSLVAKHHPLGVALAVDCMIQAARGLAFAHARGVIHRDIKPANLLRDHDGVVKVTDLGLARMNFDETDPAALSRLTMAGTVLGTVDFMPPEQAVDSTTVDHRADIYSLGATLYFLLTGQPPFAGTTVISVLLKHREAPIPSLRATRPDVPVELDDVYQRMVAKSPADRYQSMTEVVQALEGVATRLDADSLGTRGIAPAATTSASSVAIVLDEASTYSPAPPAISVVVVEPSRVQANIIRKYLEAQDIVVAAVIGTASAAVAAVREHRPTAIVSALHLSDISGVELAKQIRAEIQDHTPGFVLISSESDGADPAALSRLDRVVLLSKPFTPEQLVQALSVVTGKAVALKSSAVSVTQLAGLRPGSSLIAPTRLSPPRSTLRVLLVDDSSAARVHQRTVLSGIGFTNFTEADDGAQGIAAATREKFDLIVTDYNMPLMDGYALVSYLRQTPATATIPILMVTTETSPVILDPLRKFGVTIFDKRFPAGEVKAVIDTLFG